MMKAAIRELIERYYDFDAKYRDDNGDIDESRFTEYDETRYTLLLEFFEDVECIVWGKDQS